MSDGEGGQSTRHCRCGVPHLQRSSRSVRHWTKTQISTWEEAWSWTSSLSQVCLTSNYSLYELFQLVICTFNNWIPVAATQVPSYPDPFLFHFNKSVLVFSQTVTLPLAACAHVASPRRVTADVTASMLAEDCSQTDHSLLLHQQLALTVCGGGVHVYSTIIIGQEHPYPFYPTRLWYHNGPSAPTRSVAFFFANTV